MGEISEVEKLQRKLSEIGATFLHVEPGTDPNATAEDRARAIRESLERIEAGDFELVTGLSEDGAHG